MKHHAALLLLSVFLVTPAAAQQHEWIIDPPSAAKIDQSTDVGKALVICHEGGHFHLVGGNMGAPRGKLRIAYEAEWSHCDDIEATWQNSEDAKKHKAEEDKKAADKSFTEDLAKKLKQ